MQTTNVNYKVQAICPTNYFTIHVAGSFEEAEQCTREFAFLEGMCAELTPVSFCYTGGLEKGVSARIIAYPRFPKDTEVLFDQAERYGKALAERLCQKSFTIEGKDNSFYYLSDNPLHAK